MLRLSLTVGEHVVEAYAALDHVEAAVEEAITRIKESSTILQKVIRGIDDAGWQPHYRDLLDRVLQNLQ